MCLEEATALKEENRAASVFPDGIDEVACRSHIERPGGEGAQPGDAGEGAIVCWMKDNQVFREQSAELGSLGYFVICGREVIGGRSISEVSPVTDKERCANPSIA
jgi:hypothetical protein